MAKAITILNMRTKPAITPGSLWYNAHNPPFSRLVRNCDFDQQIVSYCLQGNPHRQYLTSLYSWWEWVKRENIPVPSAEAPGEARH